MRRFPAALFVACACAVALVIVWAAAFHSVAAGGLDRGVQSGFDAVAAAGGGERAEGVARLVDRRPFVLAGLSLIALGLLRGVRLGVGVAVVLAGSTLTTQVLQKLTAGSRANDIAAAAELWWPSGHTTGAMALALCLVLVAPGRLKGAAVAAGALFAGLVAYSLLVSGWHLPSDVLGGVLVAAGWTAAVLAALDWTGGRLRPAATTAPAGRLGVLAGTALPVAVAALAGLWLAWSDAGRALDFAAEHTAFVVLAPLLGLLALAVAGGTALAARR